MQRCFGEPLSACWCKSASKGCVSHHDQVPSRTWSPSGHAPSNFKSLIEVESTIWRRATNKELPSPRLGEQRFHAASIGAAQWSSLALDLLQDPALGRESCPDTVQEPRGSPGDLAIPVAGGRGMQRGVWAMASSVVLRGLLHPHRKERGATSIKTQTKVPRSNSSI